MMTKTGGRKSRWTVPLALSLISFFSKIMKESGLQLWLELELEPEPEPKLWPKSEPEPKINNFGSATLVLTHACIKLRGELF